MTINPREIVDESWFEVLTELYNPPLQDLSTNVLPNISYHPQPEHIFRAFQMPLNKVKVVILGQDPYPTPENANGYAYAVKPDRKKPKALHIIESEIYQSDNGNINSSKQIDMNAWTDQGVLLLNTALTVESGKAGSHLKYWEQFTKNVISFISINQPCIWLLWGKRIQSFIPQIHQNPYHVKGYDRNTIEEIPLNNDYNYFMTAPHPAAELYTGGDAGFYGCNHFYFVNRMLSNSGQQKIIW